MLNKIALVGGGQIGGILALELAKRPLCRTIAMVDVKGPDLAKGKLLDIAEGLPTIAADKKFEGSKTFDVLEGADMVINTAGVPRTTRPDGTIPTREELLKTNLGITEGVANAIKKHCPEAMVISVANPLDAIVYSLYRLLSPPKNKLIGMAGVLDAGRYRYFIAEAAGVSVENVTAMVLGGHGDDMCPIRSCTRVYGMPVEQFVSDAELTNIETRVRKAGGEVVKLLGSGSAFVSPAWGALDMAEAIIYDKKKIIPACALLEGEYGVNGLFVGVPVLFGKNGVEKVIEVAMSDAEKAAFAKSITAVQTTVDEVKAML